MPICPNCRTAIEVSAADCRKCGALFGPGSVWSPVEVPVGNRSHLVKNDFKLVTLARIVVCCSLIAGILKAAAFALVFVVFSLPIGLRNSPVAGSIFLAIAYIPLALLAFRASMKGSPFNPFVLVMAAPPLAYEVWGTVAPLLRS